MLSLQRIIMSPEEWPAADRDADDDARTDGDKSLHDDGMERVTGQQVVPNRQTGL
jgi:hypothetical protein